MHDPSKLLYNFKVPVRIQHNTKEIKHINSDVFVDVSPRKTLARFYLLCITNKSTRSGILQFLVFNSSRVLVCAKLNIPEDCGNIIESDAFWIYCVCYGYGCH